MFAEMPLDKSYGQQIRGLAATSGLSRAPFSIATNEAT
jgi:hypothetical protein